MIKKARYFFELCAYALGSIGGLGYCLYSRAWVIAAAVVVLAVMAWPEARYAFRRLME